MDRTRSGVRYLTVGRSLGQISQNCSAVRYREKLSLEQSKINRRTSDDLDKQMAPFHTRGKYARLGTVKQSIVNLSN